jgi:hypothetical protein
MLYGQECRILHVMRINLIIVRQLSHDPRHMNARMHGQFFAVATVAWAVFWLLGLPAYYQQYSSASMVWFDALLLIPFAFIFTRILGRCRPSRRLRRSLWIAFYFTVPLAIYDWLYCGVYLQHGVAFVRRYWYLSVYYLLPWLLLPSCVAWLNRAQPSSPSRPTPTSHTNDE